MLIETKIRGSDHSLAASVYAIDSRNIESKEIVSSDSSNKKLWAELIKKVDTLKDTSAFEELFNHFAPRVKAFLMKSGADPQMAEECSQEVMATVWRKAHLFDPSRASASTWIFTIARNLRIDRFRKEKRPQLDPNDPSLLPEEETPADEQLDIDDRQVVIRNAVNELPDEQREVVALSFIEGLSHQEISDRLDLPLGTVKSRLRLSFEKLRTSLRSQV